MDPAERAARMRRLEVNQGVRTLDGAWAIVRVDGRGFSKLTQERYEKPFDAVFHEQMVHTTLALVEDLQGAFAYTQSDEISLVLSRDWGLFDRRVEKIVSLAAARASAEFTHMSGAPTLFDARVWVGARDEQLCEYFEWRQSDASRCALSNVCYWTLREEGMSARKASSALSGATRSAKNELLFERGINFNDLPVWQRRGVCVERETYMKLGENPQTGEKVEVERRRLKVDEAIPMGSEFGVYALARSSS